VLNRGVSAIETDNKSKSNLSILLAIRDTDLRDRALEISYEYNFSVVAVNCCKKSSNTWLITDFPGMIFDSNRSKTLRLSSNEVASMYKFSEPDVNQLDFSKSHFHLVVN